VSSIDRRLRADLIHSVFPTHADRTEDSRDMHSISETCTVCRTTMEWIDTQPVDEQYQVLFFKCPLCAKSSQIATVCFKLVPID
jgi:hypothetical protein